jgi:hypothetical protein
MAARIDRKVILYYTQKINQNREFGQRNKILRCKKNHRNMVRKFESQYMKRKLRLIALLSLVLNVLKERTLWMHRRTDAWFLLEDKFYTDVQWYENFRVTKQTFDFVVNVIENDIKRKTTILRKPVSVQKSVAVTFYFLSSTAEYRTIANLFGVS